MIKPWMAGLLMLAGLGLAACSAPSTSTSPAAVTTAPVQQPTTAAQPTAAPTLVAQPTAAPTLVAQPTAAPQPTTAAATGQGVRLVLDSNNSQASYRAREQLLGRNLPSDAVGTTKGVKGQIMLGAGGEPVPEQSQITVDLTTLQSDERRRDTFIKSDTLQTNRFPSATFVAKDIEGLPVPLPTSGDATFQLSGDLTVHGVTRPVTWQVTATFAGAAVNGSATTTVHISDFGMTPPKAGPVLSIEDQLTLEMNFSASRDA